MKFKALNLHQDTEAEASQCDAEVSHLTCHDFMTSFRSDPSEVSWTEFPG